MKLKTNLQKNREAETTTTTKYSVVHAVLNTTTCIQAIEECC